VNFLLASFGLHTKILVEKFQVNPGSGKFCCMSQAGNSFGFLRLGLESRSAKRISDEKSRLNSGLNEFPEFCCTSQVRG
jgi:hypothetical protein